MRKGETMGDERDERGTSGKNEPVRRPYFGKRLRELRETYAQRITPEGAGLPVLRATPSASALIECMRRQCGYSISSAAYSEVENGLNVPRDARSFLDAVAVCLRLTAEEKHDLARRLAYDLVWARLRDLAPEVFPPDPNWTAD